MIDPGAYWECEQHPDEPDPACDECNPPRGRPIPLDVEHLHLMGASPASGKGGNSLDVGGIDGPRWRGEGGPSSIKRAMAQRLAYCWNMHKGWRMDDLEAGAVRTLDDLTRELVDMCADPKRSSNRAALFNHARKMQDLLRKRDDSFDFERGPKECVIETREPGWDLPW